MNAEKDLNEAWDMLSAFPKTRPYLPPEYAPLYEKMYEDNRKGRDPASSLALHLEKWMHHQVCKISEFPVLELGAGTLNHVPFESPSGVYDAVEPMSLLYQNSSNRSRIGDIYASIHAIPDHKVYQRIVSVAVLEHVTDLPATIARAALLLHPTGKMLSGIPTEGGLLWYLAWRFGTGSTFWLKHRLSYAPFMRHEHINSEAEIKEIINLFFEDVSVARYPFNIKHLSFYTAIEAAHPRRDIAQAYLSRIQDRKS